MAKLETFSLSAVRQALGCSLGELGVRQGLALQNLLLPSVCYLDSLMQVLFKAKKKKKDTQKVVISKQKNINSCKTL